MTKKQLFESKLFRFFKRYKIYLIEPFIYVNSKGQACEYEDRDKLEWLKEFKIKARDISEMCDISFDRVYKKYPEHNQKIWLAYKELANEWTSVCHPKKLEKTN